MILVSNIENKEIKIGDILFFSDCDAFLILNDYEKFYAVQLLNNGNRELGRIDYSDTSITKLEDKLIRDYGKIIKIINMDNVHLGF